MSQTKLSELFQKNTKAAEDAAYAAWQAVMELSNVTSEDNLRALEEKLAKVNTFAAILRGVISGKLPDSKGP